MTALARTSTLPEIAADFRKFLGEQDLSPERRALAEAAITAFLDFSDREDPALLAPLIAAARAPARALFEIGATLLGLLAQEFEAAREAWLGLTIDRTSTARFTAVAYLTPEMPRGFAQRVVERALADKSTKVRSKGVELASELELRALVPQLERLATDDPDEAVRRSLASWLPILRDGYRLVGTKEDGYWVHFRVPGAYISAPFHGDPTPAAIAAVIQEESARRPK
jgi:hypothetical protein